MLRHTLLLLATASIAVALIAPATAMAAPMARYT